MKTYFVPTKKVTVAQDRAKKVISILKRHRGNPVSMDVLVEQAGPYYLEVHQVVTALEAAGLVARYEEEGDTHHRVAYGWVTPAK